MEASLPCGGVSPGLYNTRISKRHKARWMIEAYDVDTILGFASFHVIISVTCTGVLIRGNTCPTRRVRP